MYKITKTPHIREELQLTNADGTEELIIPVDIDTIALTTKMQTAIGRLDEARKRINSNPHDLEAYGNAVLELFRLIFGEDGTEKIVKFYEDNYISMLVDIYPFIQTVIIPKVQEISRARKNELLKANKKMKWLKW